MSGNDDEPRLIAAAALAEITGIAADTAIVAGAILDIYGIDRLLHGLVPPDGPVFFHHTRLEFPLQWMIDVSHIAALATFAVRVIRRLMRAVLG